MLILLALSTLVAEDLTCLAAGGLVASGQLGFLSATLACLAGIVAGDLGLFWLGRFGGRRILNWPLLRSRISATQLDHAAVWLSEQGAAVVFASRFTPGMRLPVYLAAGALRTSAVRFGLLFTLASAVWTPVLVGAAALGAREAEWGIAHLWVLPLSAFLLFGGRYTLQWRNRQRTRGFVLRMVRWEFWPMWAAYLPVLPWILLLATKHRSLTLFTSANPGIFTGGFAGESKAAILRNLEPSEVVAPFTVVRRGEPPSIPRDWPVVLKPDVGERGEGVAIVKSEDDFFSHLARTNGDTIVQEYVPGLEFGILYCRRPGEVSGSILSITEKRFPVVTGDGCRTLEELIFADPRAVCLASIYLERNSRARDKVPAEGEPVRLVDIGSHCRGAIFLDAGSLHTPELSAAIDAVSRTHPGFYLGRYDIRTPSAEHLRRGDFTVIELNGVSGEPTHIYDPSVSILNKYIALYRHWWLAFEIGAANRRAGHPPMPLSVLWRTIRNHTVRARGTLPILARP